jgi:hypothetical protein
MDGSGFAEKRPFLYYTGKREHVAVTTKATMKHFRTVVYHFLVAQDILYFIRILFKDTLMVKL